MIGQPNPHNTPRIIFEFQADTYRREDATRVKNNVLGTLASIEGTSLFCGRPQRLRNPF